MKADNAISAGAFPVAGIGASAGGLEAVRALFEAMPPDLGIGFVLVQHLHPEHKSMMVDLIAKSTPLSVVQVEDGMPVLPNRVHVIPPNNALKITQGVLRLGEPSARRGLRMPIDDFFISLAEDQHEQAIGIVLSGTGSDGTAGVGMIKVRGGMLMAQDPGQAAHTGMPRSAIASGQVDYVLPVSEMPDALAAYVEHRRLGGVGLPASAVNEQATEQIIALIRARQGHDLSWYKPATLRRRLLRRMALGQIKTVDDYVTRLGNDDAELLALTKDLLISVTAFFRDADAWDELAAKALPELLRRVQADEAVRVWVPGCATGEEAYTVAILLTEALEAAGRGNQLVVFATDVDRDALDTARAGHYPESLVADVDPRRLARFFTREDAHYQVKKFLRERVIVAPQDLLGDPPFSTIDLISCRNLLIYVDSEYQQRLMSLFHFSLRNGGILLLGSAENIAGQERLFRSISAKWRIYQRRDGDAKRALAFSGQGRRSLSRGLGDGGRASAIGKGYRSWIEDALLDRFTPPAVLVDDAGEALYYHGDVGRYLAPSAGAPSNEVLRLVDERLRAKLRVALREVARRDAPAVIRNGEVERGDAVQAVRVTVTPVKGPDSASQQRLITFEDLAVGPRPRPDDAPAPHRVEALEQELASTRQELLTTIQESDATNEELQASVQEVMSMNEELQSSNEELETSKEELQSLNQELTTLNNQLEVKLQELEQTNDDLTNLLFSTDIAILFLDRDLRVRRYTPDATRLLRLIPSDIGRPITDIARCFDDANLIADARATLAGAEPPAREIKSESEKWYLRRLRPYRTERVPISGVVITFTEMTARKEAELALAESERALRRVADAMPALIARISRDLRYTFNNAAYADWFGVDPDSLCGTLVQDLVGDEAFGLVREHLEAALAGERAGLDAWLPYRRGERRFCHVDYIPDQRDDGQVSGVFALVTDLTERHRSQEAIERLNAENRARATELQALLDAAPGGILVARDPSCERIDINKAGAQILGLTQDTAMSVSRRDAAMPRCRASQDGHELADDELPMYVAARTGRPVQDYAIEILRRDGTIKSVITAAAPLLDAHGAVCGVVGILTDVTALNQAERHYRETLERLNKHIENSPVAALEWDDQLCVLRWSPAAERMFGWSEAEALRRSLDELRLFSDGERDQARAMISRLFSGEVERTRGLYNNRTKSGGDRWCEWCSSALRDADGRLVSVLSLAMDVSEHQALESSLREQARRLEAADQRKNEFLSMLGHELRNPLAPVRNALDRLAIAEGDGETQRRALGLIDRQVGHIERLVQDLLDVARINRGAIELIIAPHDLRGLVRESLDAFEETIRRRAHRLSVTMPPEPVIVNADETRVVQVLSNLLQNATKYTDDGGRIEVLVEVDGSNARVAIEDNGRGIEQGAITSLFEAFSQGRRPLDRADGGLGIGLTLVKQLVELHGGSIEAHSDGPQRGSRFTVLLPLRGDSITDAQEQQAPDHAPGGHAAPEHRQAQRGRQVLVVDDNAEVLESVIMLLSAMGHCPVGASTGSEALALIAASPPDVVLLDIGLPEIDGVEVARRLAAMPERARLKLVALSGYGPSVLGEDAKLFDEHLVKPAGRDALQAILD